MGRAFHKRTQLEIAAVIAVPPRTPMTAPSSRRQARCPSGRARKTRNSGTAAPECRLGPHARSSRGSGSVLRRGKWEPLGRNHAAREPSRSLSRRSTAPFGMLKNRSMTSPVSTANEDHTNSKTPASPQNVRHLTRVDDYAKPARKNSPGENGKKACSSERISYFGCVFMGLAVIHPPLFQRR
jgi:hypothetical protein